MMYLFICVDMLVSQALFLKTYGIASSSEGFSSMVHTSDGGFVVSGSTYNHITEDEDLLILKLDVSGNLEWAKTFGGTGSDYARSIVQTTDGGYAVLGETWSFGAGSYDLFVLKLTSSGDLAWAKTFGGTYQEFSRSITLTSDGGCAVASVTGSFGAGGWDLLLLKLTSSGTLQWAKTFGVTGTSGEWPMSIIQTSDGGYAVAGWTDGYGAGWEDLLLLKLTSSGTLQWAKTFGGTGNEEARSIIQTSDGGYVVAGMTMSFGAGREDILVLKLTSSGDLVWAKTFGGTGWEEPSRIVQTSDGGYAIPGGTYDAGPSQWDILVLKLTSSGDWEWSTKFGGADDDGAVSIVQTSDGGYVLAGGTWSFGTGYQDCLLLKVGSDGSYPGCLVDFPLNDATPTPNTSLPTLNTYSPSVGANCSPTVGTPTLTITDVCAPVELEGSDPLPGKRITCSSFSGGILFNSPADLGIKIYSVDGRVAYSGQLQGGENRINLGRGVYLWIAGRFMGKATVR